MTERDEGNERRSLPVRVWRSIFRGPVVPRTDQERKWVVFNSDKSGVQQIYAAEIPESMIDELESE